jgi:hypothetical protein
MTNSLLQSLREQILDESEPLAGLLRKCLLLGAETGSDSLRRWVRYELNGYDDDVDVPDYRRIPNPPIKVDSVSGNMWTKGQMFHRLQLPIEAQKAVPEWIYFRQPIEELETLALSETLSFKTAGLSYAQTIWNDKLDTFQQIVGMSFVLSNSRVAGILGQVRTQLVDIVADLTADTPLTELPKKDQVDAAVGQHVGTQYNTTIHAAHGPTAIGTETEATVRGLTVDEAVKLLDAVRAASSEVGNDDGRADLLSAIEDLRAEAEKTTPDTGEVVKKVGRLRAVAEGIGLPSLTAAVGGAVEAFTSLAMSGAFG